MPLNLTCTTLALRTSKCAKPVTPQSLLAGQYAPELKPRWFLELNPNAKVPVLVYKEGQDMHQVGGLDPVQKEIMSSGPL